ncbi:MAG TPA: hypothetical protein PLD47_16855 [Aggregatilineales bacterium]|nr:hypothetical protein [Anaerolineales bacterium]HRE49397.1 hypothetical protein [Aggregatilineales bacterium]
MPANLELIEDGRVAYIVFTDPWHMDNLYTNAEMVFKHLNTLSQTSKKCHSLIDMSKMRHIPQGILRMRALPGWKHPNNGIAIVFGASIIVDILLQAMARLLPNQLIITKTEAEARAKLSALLAAEDALQAKAVSVDLPPEIDTPVKSSMDASSEPPIQPPTEGIT